MEYEETRLKLFIKSFVGKQTITFLRNKYGIKKGMKPEDWYDRIDREKRIKIDKLILKLHLSASSSFSKPLCYQMLLDDKDVTPEITKLSNEVRLNEDVLRSYIILNILTPTIPQQDIIRLATEGYPINEDGYYIKVDKSTKDKDVKIAYEIIQDRIQKQQQLFDLLGVKKKKPLIKRRRTQIAPDDEEKIKIFLKIESEMCLLFENKRNIKSDYEARDYERELIGAAIQRVAGDRMPDIEDDEKFQANLNITTQLFETWYYSITERYQLPTPKKLSSILRVISS